MSQTPKNGQAQMELDFFNDQLLMLVESDLPAPGAIRRLAGQARDKSFRKELSDLAERIEDGQSLSEAMAKSPEVFPADYVAIIGAGEQTGDLAKALRLCIEHERGRRRFQSQIKVKLVYPLTALLLVSISFVAIVALPYPILESITHAMGSDPPFLTRMVFGTYSWLGHYGYIPLALLAIAVYYLFYGPGRRLSHSLATSLPVVGPIAISRFLAAFSGLMSMALRSGMPAHQALDLAARVNPNLDISDRLARAAKKVEEGLDLVQALEGAGKIPETFLSVLAVGQEAGVLAESFEGLERLYHSEARQSSEAFVYFLDIAMTVLMGAWTTALLVSYYVIYMNVIINIDQDLIW